MKTTKFNKLFIVLVSVMMLSLTFAFVFTNSNLVNADETPVFEMINGASIRLSSEDESGIRFTAKITDVNKDYKVLIVYKKMLEGVTNPDIIQGLVDKFSANGVTMENFTQKFTVVGNITPMEDETYGWVINGSIVQIPNSEFGSEFIGIAYYEEGGVRTYANYNLSNARKISDVAFSALADKTKNWGENEVNSLMSFSGATEIVTGSWGETFLPNGLNLMRNDVLTFDIAPITSGQVSLMPYLGWDKRTERIQLNVEDPATYPKYVKVISKGNNVYSVVINLLEVAVPGDNSGATYSTVFDCIRFNPIDAYFYISNINKLERFNDLDQITKGWDETFLPSGLNLMRKDKLKFDIYMMTSGQVSLMPYLGWDKRTERIQFNVEDPATYKDYMEVVAKKDGVYSITVDISKVAVPGDDSGATYSTVFDCLRYDPFNAGFLIGNFEKIEGELPPRGESFTAGTDRNFKNLVLTNGVSFEYKITSGDHFNISLLNNSNWDKYYGYYEFTADGARSNYAGITTTKLPDGYIKVDIIFDQLNRTGNSNNKENAPELAVNYIYLRGGWTDANGFIDNICDYTPVA